MVGRRVSFWEGLLSGAMLVVGRVRRSRLRLESAHHCAKLKKLWDQTWHGSALGPWTDSLEGGCFKHAPKKYLSQSGRGSHNPILRGQQLAIYGY